MVRYSNASEFKTKLLKALTKDLRVHVKDGAVTITSKGIKEIEAKIVGLRNS